MIIEPDTILVFLEGDPGLPILAYDTSADAWSALHPVVVAPLGTGTDDVFERANDGFIYRFAGATETIVHRYDPSSNSWDRQAVAMLGDSFVSDAVALESGSMLLVSPGVGATTCLRSFDPATGAAGPIRCEPGSYRHAARAADGTILAFGTDGAARYDLLAEAWTQLDPPPANLLATGMGLGPDGRVYSIGGSPSSGIVESLAVAFDPLLGRWRLVPLPGVARTEPEVVAGPDSLLYLIGGGSPNLPEGGPHLELTVEVFEPSS